MGRQSISNAPVRGSVAKAQKKFLYYFKGGFGSEKYYDWERGYKWEAHRQWCEVLNEKNFKALLAKGAYNDIAALAVRIESRTNLLFSFEKMALRDAIRSEEGARIFAEGLYDLVYGKSRLETRMKKWIDAVAQLPRKQTRVLTWPLVTVFGFIANPQEHIFLKPRVTKVAAEKYGFDFRYQSRPNWDTFASYLAFAEQVGADNAGLHPKDMIDIQSFIWVQGSDEYPD